MENSESSDEQVSPEKMKEILTYLETKSLQKIKHDDHEDALQTLDEMEQILESLVLAGTLEQPDFILSALYNTALCHQKLE